MRKRLREDIHAEGDRAHGSLVWHPHLAGSLHLEVVLLVRRALENSALGVKLPALALASAHNNVNGIRLVPLNGALLNLVARHVFVGNDLRAINGEPFDLMGHDTVHSLAAKGVNALLDQRSDFIVLLACVQKGISPALSRKSSTLNASRLEASRL